MASKRPVDQEADKKALEEFLKAAPDAATVHKVPQPLELHVTGTTAYIPSYTRQVMDKNHGAPIMAVHTKTDAAAKKVFIYPAENPKEKTARKLRSTESMGPAQFAFGVPLRKLSLKLPASRRVILSLNTLEVPEQGTVYWTSFADIETELRNINDDGTEAEKPAKTVQSKMGQAAAAAQPEED